MENVTLRKKQMKETVSCVSEVTDEDGSDCFSAVHRFVFK